MKARFAVLVMLGTALAAGCRRAETPAPSPSPTVALATPTPAPPPRPLRRPPPSRLLRPPLLGRRRPPRPLARHRAGARPVPGPLRDDQGAVRRRGDARVGAPRGRPLLQPRAGRLLRRRRLLPRDRRLHGPVRDQRRPAGQRRVAGGAHPRRPGHPVEPPRDGDLRDGGPGHADHPALHQLQGQQGPRRAGVRPLRRRGRRALPSWTRCTPATARARPGAWARTRGAPRPRATPTCAGRSRGWTSSRPPAW